MRILIRVIVAVLAAAFWLAASAGVVAFSACSAHLRSEPFLTVVGSGFALAIAAAGVAQVVGMVRSWRSEESP